VSSQARANAQTPSGDNAQIFLGPEVRSSQNICWPFRIKELSNHFETANNHPGIE